MKEEHKGLLLFGGVFGGVVLGYALLPEDWRWVLTAFLILAVIVIGWNVFVVTMSLRILQRETTPMIDKLIEVDDDDWDTQFLLIQAIDASFVRSNKWLERTLWPFDRAFVHSYPPK